MEYWVYLLRCADNSLYTGATNNISRRLDEHNNNKAKSAKYTAYRRPVRLERTWVVFSWSDALRLEHLIKRCKKEFKESLIKKPENILTLAEKQGLDFKIKIIT